ncbi:22526_t:CDS:2 [Entrophospora sp. SA101]|nr:22526_t:CDS:2 [Entrophospora sp. SA101]
MIEQPRFTPELQKEWEKREFKYKQAREWINIGLSPKDADYAR